MNGPPLAPFREGELECAGVTMEGAYSDAKVANRNVRGEGFRVGWAHAAVSRRPPISLDNIVARTHMYTHTDKFGVRLSFKDHFLSRRAKR
jgi:hypothetical protein